MACHLFIFTASRAWHRGKAQSEKQVTEEIWRWDDSLNSTEILRHLNENADKAETLMDMIASMDRTVGVLLGVVKDMNQAVGELIKMGGKRMAEHEDEPPIPPALVS